MSKQIAQTVGDKRVAVLIALLAAFAVLATVATQWQKSEAAFPDIAFAVTVSDTTPDPGQTITYTVTSTVSGSATPAALTPVLRINFDSDLTWDGIAPVATANMFGTGSSCSVTGTQLNCNSVAAGSYTNGTVTVTFIVPFEGGEISPPAGGLTGGACAIDSTAETCTVSIPTVVVENAVQVEPEVATNALGVEHTFTFIFPPDFTCESDLDGDLITPECEESDVILSGNLEFVSIGPGPATEFGSDTIEVTVVNSTPTPGSSGEVCLSVALGDEEPVVVPLNGQQVDALVRTTEPFESECGLKNWIAGELRHVNDDGELVVNAAGQVIQEVNNNVRGSQHTVCVADDFGNPVLIPQLNAQPSDFINQPADAYNGLEPVIPQTPTASNIVVFEGNGDNGGLDGATCVSWYSTGAGDQQLSLDYVGADGATYTIDWDTDDDGNTIVIDTDLEGPGRASPVNDSLIKEWNVLEDSTVCIDGYGCQTMDTDGVDEDVEDPFEIEIPLYLNPGNGGYQWSDSSLTIEDVFNGSHLNSGAQTENVNGLVGVEWDIDVEGTCGDWNFPNGSSGTTELAESDDALGEVSDNTEPEVNVFDVGDCVVGDTIVIVISGCEGPLASGEGLCVFQDIIITFSAPPPTQKQVFLAWAGQRVIIEHDWRIPPGDEPGDDGSTDGLGFCPLDDNTTIVYIKGGGPGNFLEGLGADTNGSDQAFIDLDDDAGGDQQWSQFPDQVNDNCISRVLYESEQPGQVDIEAFVEDDEFDDDPDVFNVTKHAVVIYYMKINTINVSLVSQVSKLDHNATSNNSYWSDGAQAHPGTAGDYSPGNPWDATKDDADNAVDWNVSRDILVRGRVTGWFLNENPSGRPADTSNALNVLPANRWVMPNDWPLLAGGPVDPADGTDAIGTAEQFRPYYDIMFAPNNSRGTSLASPINVDLDATFDASATVAAVVVAAPAGLTNTSGTFSVNTCANLPDSANGAALVVGTTLVTLTDCAGTRLTVTGLTSAPAAGTLVLLVSVVPFEGPYSLIDIPGLAAQGLGGAALSNILPGQIRDTILGDGDVDMWDAPMPPAEVSVNIRGTGFIKEVLKSDVYYNGTANTGTQVFPNAFYASNIPDSPFIPAIVVGGGYHWNSWGNDGPGDNGDGAYFFWEPAVIGTNAAGFGDPSVTAAQAAELDVIRGIYGDNTIARDLVIYSDNHGEFMVTANGDFKTDLAACATNVLAGGKHCKPGDKVGTGRIEATVDYPDFRGKHFPVLSNPVNVSWTWGGYKDVTVEDGETDQFKYIVFHAMDRDGWCAVPTNAVSLHPVLSSEDAKNTVIGSQAVDPVETVDFLIDSGEGIIIDSSDGSTTPTPINDGRQFATKITTFSTAVNTTKKEFPLSSLAAAGATDECQAWIKVSNSLLGILNVLAIAHDDEGDIGFDRIIDLTNTTSYTLNFRWSLITWAGADGIPVADALGGTGANDEGNDISASVTAVYGWDAAAQQWLGYFPSGVNVPGANDLTALEAGEAYWIAITGPSSVTWTIASNVN